MIRLRTQYRNVTLCVEEDGRLLMNGVEVGRLFPDEHDLIAMAVEDAQQEEKAA